MSSLSAIDWAKQRNLNSFFDDSLLRSPDSAFFDDNIRENLSYQELDLPCDDCLVETSDPAVFAADSPTCPEIMDLEREFDRDLMYLNEDVFDSLNMDSVGVNKTNTPTPDICKPSEDSNETPCFDSVSSSVSNCSLKSEDFTVPKLKISVPKPEPANPDDKPSLRTSERIRNERRRSISTGSDYFYDNDEKPDTPTVPVRRRGRPRIRRFDDDSDWCPITNRCKKKKKYEESPSTDPLEEKSRKNAVIAKKNRERKKMYIWELENKTNCLETENNTLKLDCERLKQCIIEKDNENRYLRNVLANQSTLSALLKGLSSIQSVRVKSNFPHEVEKPISGSGVCLHVAGNEATLEFCAKCADNAKIS